jgi:hypothetical protein
MPSSRYAAVCHSRELTSLLTSPKCGLCIHFPIESSNFFFCSIYDDHIRYRTSKPPRYCARPNNFICFSPIDEPFYIRLLEYKYEKSLESTRDGRRRSPSVSRACARRWYAEHKKEVISSIRERRRLNPQPHRDEVRVYQKSHPEVARRSSAKYRLKKKILEFYVTYPQR